jgi:AMMECR1 domain-containing protein
LRKEELKEIVLEISIIPYLERIPDLTSFTPGKDGLYLVGPSFRGTLLPQVAERVENDRERFVDLLLKKIGINRSDLLDPRVILYRYPVWIVREKSR